MTTELGPLIIEAAVNGGTPKSRNPNVPRTPGEIADDAVRCVDARAAIVHNHNDDPVIGAGPTHDAEPYLAANTGAAAGYNALPNDGQRRSGHGCRRALFAH